MLFAVKKKGARLPDKIAGSYLVGSKDMVGFCLAGGEVGASEPQGEGRSLEVHR